MNGIPRGRFQQDVAGRMKLFRARVLIFLAAFALTFLTVSVQASFARKSKEKHETQLRLPEGQQPYVHHWFGTKTKQGASVFGQVYRPRKDLVVLEMVPEAEKQPVFGTGREGSKRVGLPGSAPKAEVTAVRIKTKDGKIYESQVRKVPSWFMPTARKNYRSPLSEIEKPPPDLIEKEAT